MDNNELKLLLDWKLDIVFFLKEKTIHQLLGMQDNVLENLKNFNAKFIKIFTFVNIFQAITFSSVVFLNKKHWFIELKIGIFLAFIIGFSLIINRYLYSYSKTKDDLEKRLKQKILKNLRDNSEKEFFMLHDTNIFKNTIQCDEDTKLLGKRVFNYKGVCVENFSKTSFCYISKPNRAYDSEQILVFLEQMRRFQRAKLIVLRHEFKFNIFMIGISTFLIIGVLTTWWITLITIMISPCCYFFVKNKKILVNSMDDHFESYFKNLVELRLDYQSGLFSIN